MPPSNEGKSEEDGPRTQRMPQVIHLAPTFQVDSPSKPFVIEDLTGFEVIKGRYTLTISIKNSDENLVAGERIDSSRGPVFGRQSIPNSKDMEHNNAHVHLGKSTVRCEPWDRDVAQASSLFKSPSKLSDITFSDDKGNETDEFERVRISL